MIIFQIVIISQEMQRENKSPFNKLSPNKSRKLPSQINDTSPLKSKNDKKITNNLPTFAINERLFSFTPIQQLYSKLTFNNFQPFPFQQIQESKAHISNLYKQLKIDKGQKNLKKKNQIKTQVRCVHHSEVLNLYCQKQRQIICVGCVYKDQKHKGHNIVPLDKVIKTLTIESQRIREKIHGIIDKLLQWQQRIEKQHNDIAEAYHHISNATNIFFSELTNEVKRIQTEFSQSIKKNFLRTAKIVDLYGQSVKKTKNMFHDQIRSANDMDEVTSIILLRQVSFELGLSERLIKKTNQMLTNVSIWKQIQNNFQKLTQKWKKEDQKLLQREIIVTQF